MITDKIQQIRTVIEQTARSCGRDPATIRLVAVSKRFNTQAINEAMAAGQTLFGENYLQEAKDKVQQLGKGADFHFIGHLQSNKAKEAAGLFSMIETIDRAKIARALDKRLNATGGEMDVLIQVNIGREPQKSGVLPEDCAQLAKELADLPRLQLKGLMCLPPAGPRAEDSRPHFRALRLLANDLQAQGLLPQKGLELSMGMSHDFSVAIEEGATLVRVGTAIFGQRPPRS